MEPYSADKIKREKRRYHNFEPVWLFPYPSPLILTNKQDTIEDSTEFKKRPLEFQRIMRKEFD